MSENDAEKRPERDEHGRLLPGHTMRSPGRTSYPDWFKAKGDVALKRLAAVAEGEQEDARVSPCQACIEIISRLYGTAPKAPEDADAAERVWAEMLSRFRTSEGE